MEPAIQRVTNSPRDVDEDLVRVRASDAEQTRIVDLMRLVPTGRASVLDVGARDGYISRKLLGFFSQVTALDLVEPRFNIPGVAKVAGDATNLQFPDNSFDCVICAEVLEHIPDVSTACREIARVAKHDIIIGVPYRQDTRVGRTTCRGCGKTNPPWGHVNEFDSERLEKLFSGVRLVETSFVGTSKERTNPLSTALRDFAGNPWGVYSQGEPCIHCGEALKAPVALSIVDRVCVKIAAILDRIQAPLVQAHGNWIHMRFEKNP